jgi:1-acyl-sn-glycerol-3-phosphate acyltransferase
MAEFVSGERVLAPYDDLSWLPPAQAWRLAQALLRPTWRQLMRLRVYGLDRLPRTGPAVLAANHQSLADIFAFGMAVQPRSIRYMAKVELWDIPVIGWLMPHSGAFPVRRGGGDREAIQQAKQVIASSNLLGIFVEGTRQDEISEVLPGAAMVAIATGAPIIVSCIHGSSLHGRDPRNPVSISFSTPLDLGSFGRGSKAYRTASRVLRRNLEIQMAFLRSVEAAGRPKRATPPEATLDVGEIDA